MNCTVRRHSQIKDIPELQWQSLVTDDTSPFMEWGWLEHMEASGSVSVARGWTGSHLSVWQGKKLLAAAPLYLRWENTGEFVFDYLWQEIAEKYQMPYLPKLVGMSPLTPVPAYQFLIHPDASKKELLDLIFHEISLLAQSLPLGLVQFNFVLPSFLSELITRGWAPWQHQGYRLINTFDSFSDYLNKFTKNQRRNIRRERESTKKQELTLRIIPATECPSHFFSLMAEYYLTTNQKFGIWAAHYLTNDFFLCMPAQVKKHLFFAAAFSRTDPETPLALALLVKKHTTLYGRYWGTTEFHPNLHFNLCYYLPIEWMIEQKLQFFDPGMGAEHKTRRGFNAVPLYSCHQFQHPAFHQFFCDNIHKINEAEQLYLDALNQHLPTKLLD